MDRQDEGAIASCDSVHFVRSIEADAPQPFDGDMRQASQIAIRSRH